MSSNGLVHTKRTSLPEFTADEAAAMNALDMGVLKANAKYVLAVLPGQKMLFKIIERFERHLGIVASYETESEAMQQWSVRYNHTDEYLDSQQP